MRDDRKCEPCFITFNTALESRQICLPIMLYKGQKTVSRSHFHPARSNVTTSTHPVLEWYLCRKLALTLSACICMARAWQKYATDKASCRGIAAARRTVSVARTIMMTIHQASPALSDSTTNTQTKLV